MTTSTRGAKGVPPKTSSSIFSPIKELQNPTKLKKKESTRLDRISDLQGVLKDFKKI
jgi:hypothetical protein